MLMQAPAVVLGGPRKPVRYLLRDRFATDDPAPIAAPRTAEPGPGTWAVTDVEAAISVAGGRLRGLIQATAQWGEAELRGPATARMAGRALLALVTLDDSSSDLAVGWSPSATAGDPRTSGHGWLVENGGLLAIAPGVKVPLDVGSATARPIRPLQLLVAVVLREAGAYVLLSSWADGDGLGCLGPLTIPAYPDALLVWVEAADATATLYPYLSGFDAGGGGAGYPGGHAIEDVRVVDLGGAWAERFGLAQVGDEFDRADDAGSLGTADKGGAWTVDSGTFGISGNQARLEAGGSYNLAWLPAVADGVLRCRVTIPASGTPVWGFGVRRVSAGNYLRLTNFGGNQIQLGTVIGGTYTTLAGMSSAFTWVAGQTYEIALVFKGNAYGCFVDGVQQWGGWKSDPGSTFLAGTGCGLVHAGIASRATFDRFSVHPLTVTLPALVGRGRVPDVRTSGAHLASDSFTDTAGTRLQAHAAESGGAWTEHSGIWTIDASGRAAAIFAGAWAIATQQLGVADVEATVTVKQHANFPSGTTLAGVVARANDDNNFVLVRLYMHASQAGSDEVEVLEVIGGVATVVRKVHLGDLLASGGENALAVRCLGDRLHVLLDGAPRLSHILTPPFMAVGGTRFGIGRITGDDGCTFDGWQARAL